MCAINTTVIAASVDTYPSKRIRIVTAEAGGAPDMVSRVIAQGIAPRLGQPVVVENHGGGVIAPEIAARSDPDGYTLLAYGNTFWLMPLMRSKMSFDPIKDFTPITVAAKTPLVLIVHPSLPVHSVPQLISLAKAKPGALNYSSAATGTGNHLAAELFKSMARINVVRVPYKGLASALNALVSGETEIMFANIGPGIAQAKAGRVRALATTGIKPSPIAQNIPTLAATGLPGFEAEARVGFFVPAKTPEAVVGLISREITWALGQPEAKERLLNTGLETVATSPEETAATIKAEIARLGKVIREAGIRDE